MHKIWTVMAKKRKRSYEERIVSALHKLPGPVEDKRHNLSIYFNNDRARSNETRFEHASDTSHKLNENDIERIPRLIKECKFKKDDKRTKTFNINSKKSPILI